MTTMFGVMRVIVQYLLQPLPFCLTFIPPIAIYFINRKYIWFSILLTVIVELIINWGNFCYYESRGLMILVTLAQVFVMVLTILILKVVASRRKR